MSAFVLSSEFVAWFDGTGTLSGTVKDASDVSVQRRVLLFERNSAVLARKADSAGGTFSFPNLSTSEKFFAVCFDDDAGTQYNAFIFDLLTPA